MDINDVAKLAPTILGFLGGPAGGLVGAGLEWLAGQLGASDKTQESIKAALVNADPIKLKELDLDFQKFCLQNGIQLQMAQIEVNKIEAANPNVFVSGWRPAAGWICDAGLLYQFIFWPIANGFSMIFSGKPVFPSLDVQTLLTLISGMLGFGYLRTVEKKAGVEGSHQ